MSFCGTVAIFIPASEMKNVHPARICNTCPTSKFIEDITRWREDMNFMFEGQEQYLTRSLRSLVRYCSCHENIKFISSSQRVMFFLLYGD